MTLEVLGEFQGWCDGSGAAQPWVSLDYRDESTLCLGCAVENREAAYDSAKSEHYEMLEQQNVAQRMTVAVASHTTACYTLSPGISRH